MHKQITEYLLAIWHIILLYTCSGVIAYGPELMQHQDLGLKVQPSMSTGVMIP